MRSSVSGGVSGQKARPALCVHVRSSCPRAVARARPPAVREAIHETAIPPRAVRRAPRPAPAPPGSCLSLTKPAQSRHPAPVPAHGAPGAASLARPRCRRPSVLARRLLLHDGASRVSSPDGVTANKHSDFTPARQSPDSSGRGGGPTAPQGSTPPAVPAGRHPPLSLGHGRVSPPP